MVAQLTRRERELALLVLGLLALCGLVMAAAANDDLFALHGGLVLVFAVALAFLVISGLHAPEPTGDRQAEYYDDPSRVGIVLTMGWAVFGMAIGDWVAWMLAYPHLTFDAAWTVEVHFWLALAGTIIYIFAMWNSGVIQGLMWRTYDAGGTLAYPFIETVVAMHPYYVARAIGGSTFPGRGADWELERLDDHPRAGPRLAIGRHRPAADRPGGGVSRCSVCITSWKNIPSPCCSASSSSPPSAAW